MCRKTDVSVESVRGEISGEVSVRGEDLSRVDRVALRALVKMGANQGEG